MDRAKVLSNSIKQKRKEKAGKWEVPLPKVRHADLAYTYLAMHSPVLGTSAKTIDYTCR